MFEENKKEIIIFLAIVIFSVVAGIILMKDNAPSSANYIGDSSKMNVYSISKYIECNVYIRKKHMFHFKELQEALEQNYTLIENC